MRGAGREVKVSISPLLMPPVLQEYCVNLELFNLNAYCGACAVLAERSVDQVEAALAFVEAHLIIILKTGRTARGGE